MQQRPLAQGADAGNLLQAAFAQSAFAPLAVRADREAVRLVAQPLDEVEQRRPRRQPERRAPRHKERFAAGVTIRPFGDCHQRHVGDAKLRQRLARHRQLALPAVDQHEVGPRRLGPVVGVRRLRCGVLRLVRFRIEIGLEFGLQFGLQVGFKVGLEVGRRRDGFLLHGARRALGGTRRPHP